MAQNATLIISQPGHRTRKVEVSDCVMSSGRASGNSVPLKHDRNVSRHHAAITPREDGYWLSDLTTRNGTTVNGNLVESEHKLSDGDLICLGGASTIEFSAPQTGETPAVRDIQGVEGNEESPGSDSPISTTEIQTPRRISTAAVFGVLGGLAVTATFVCILFATGLVKAGNGKKSSLNADPQPGATPFIEVADATPSPTPEAGPTETLGPTPGPTADAGEQMGAAQVLAAKISPKNYKFDPAFVALITGYVQEYKSSAGYYGRARKYRDAIDKEFVNVQGLPPVFGYVMALSRTGFVEANGDVWSLPKSITKAEAVPVAVSDPTIGSTKMAASYIRGLWDVFGKEGFMYAVACYGMTLDEAGEIQRQLEAKDPTGQGRFDFWRMKNMGVVKGDQVERVARFFAAGIVAENPQQFGLSEPPLSTLY